MGLGAYEERSQPFYFLKWKDEMHSYGVIFCLWFGDICHYEGIIILGYIFNQQSCRHIHA